MPPPPWPSRIVEGALALVVLLALWGDLSRFVDPLGDKLVFYMPPGAADFIAPYQGARALVAGEDPYRNQRDDLRDPWHRETVVDGARTSQFYPPTHLLLLAPLVPLYGDDLRGAGRAWFAINFLSLLALGLVTARLAMRALGATALPHHAERVVVALFCVAASALHGGALLALERGQSDPLIALAAWGAILLALDGKFARAAALAMAATLFKGYALGVLAGVVACARDRRTLGRALGGAAAALVVGLAPVGRYLPEALANMRARVGNFHPAWYNVSFRSLTELTTPFAARPLSWLSCALAGVAALLALVAARRAVDERARARWLAAFGATAMTATLGAPAVTYSYALANILPGALVLAMTHEPLADELALSSRGRRLLSAMVILMLLLLYKLRLASEVFPLAPLGLLVLAATVAMLAARALGAKGASPTP